MPRRHSKVLDFLLNELIAGIIVSIILTLFMITWLAYSDFYDVLNSLDPATWTPWSLIMIVTILIAVLTSVFVNLLISRRRKTDMRENIIITITSFIVLLVSIIIMSLIYVWINAPAYFLNLSLSDKILASMTINIAYFSIHAFEVNGVYQPSLMWGIVILMYFILFQLMKIILKR